MWSSGPEYTSNKDVVERGSVVYAKLGTHQCIRDIKFSRLTESLVPVTRTSCTIFTDMHTQHTRE